MKRLLSTCLFFFACALPVAANTDLNINGHDFLIPEWWEAHDVCISYGTNLRCNFENARIKDVRVYYRLKLDPTYGCELYVKELQPGKYEVKLARRSGLSHTPKPAHGETIRRFVCGTRWISHDTLDVRATYTRDSVGPESPAQSDEPAQFTR